jgi:putative Mn2+ efflux pump MntP
MVVTLVGEVVGATLGRLLGKLDGCNVGILFTSVGDNVEVTISSVGLIVGLNTVIFVGAIEGTTSIVGAIVGNSVRFCCDVSFDVSTE